MNLIINGELAELISENIYEVESQGLDSQKQLIGTLVHGDERYQITIEVTRDEMDFIDYEDHVPGYKYSDGDIIKIKDPA